MYLKTECMVFSFKTFKKSVEFCGGGLFMGDYISMFPQLDSKDFNLFGGGIKFHSYERCANHGRIYVTITTTTIIPGWLVWRLYKQKSETKPIQYMVDAQAPANSKQTQQPSRSRNTWQLQTSGMRCVCRELTHPKPSHLN